MCSCISDWEIGHSNIKLLLKMTSCNTSSGSANNDYYLQKKKMKTKQWSEKKKLWKNGTSKQIHAKKYQIKTFSTCRKTGQIDLTIFAYLFALPCIQDIEYSVASIKEQFTFSIFRYCLDSWNSCKVSNIESEIIKTALWIYKYNGMQQLYIFHLLFGTVIVMKTINSQRNEKKLKISSIFLLHVLWLNKI